MSGTVWDTTDPLEQVLYEKSLSLVQVLYVFKCHSEIESMREHILKQCARVLSQWQGVEHADPRYKMCFATLLREAEAFPDMVSEALRLLCTPEQIDQLYPTGLLRSVPDVKQCLGRLFTGNMHMEPLAHCKQNIDSLISEALSDP